ncbi:oligosaccharide flippase family protein [Halobacillus shinanisalinarum]|uniref:Oligosaccharide flippase family protein n=1 Tax=Halobacillus shinanisalinarum TaxID=2932258 RepID=A0ABY4GTL9_9BACI|nr:oligosaccharide flippase family protein [Halobacillus shinanisalinarum]UOQ91359.1 oligosaccharide flippase family protein [Halobacillus shinanisalinarum]
MNHSNSSHLIFKGAFLLTLSGLIGKVLSAGYRIPLQNIAGDLGFYIYQQIYPILGMALILSLYGFPVAISKLVAEVREQGKALSLSSFYVPALSWLFGICGVIFFIGYTQSDELAALMGDKHLTPSLQAAFFVFLFLPFPSLLRGVYQGGGNMQPTAISQVVEQFVRVLFIIMATIYVVNKGELYHIGIGASIASLGGIIASAIVFLFIINKNPPWTSGSMEYSSLAFLKTIVFYGLFICLNYMLLLLIQMTDALTLVPGLIEAGEESKRAKLLKGVFDRGQPLIQLGTVLASSLALAVVPSVTKRRLKEEPRLIEGYIFGSVKFSLLIAGGATAGLIVLFPFINELFFQDTEGTAVLRVLMLVILFSSLAITLSSILQGLGLVTHTAIVVLLAIAVKWGLNIWLVPSLKLNGAAIASIVSVVLVVVGHLVLLRHDFSLKKWLRLPWLSTSLAVLGMMGVLLALIQIKQGMDMSENRLFLLFYTLSLTAIGALTYFVLLIRLGALTKRELETLPYGRWLVRLLPKGLNR